jgi:hypothetical protein
LMYTSPLLAGSYRPVSCRKDAQSTLRGHTRSRGCQRGARQSGTGAPCGAPCHLRSRRWQCAARRAPRPRTPRRPVRRRVVGYIPARPAREQPTGVRSSCATGHCGNLRSGTRCVTQLRSLRPAVNCPSSVVEVDRRPGAAIQLTSGIIWDASTRSRLPHRAHRLAVLRRAWRRRWGLFARASPGVTRSRAMGRKVARVRERAAVQIRPSRTFSPSPTAVERTHPQ